MSESSRHHDAPVTRLAPSPTGALHLGNARTFLINWAVARRAGWRIILRIDDLAGPRVKRDAAQQAIEDLRWLGLDWDDGPFFQSHDLDPYRTAMSELSRSGLVFPSDLTRKEIEAALAAPHAPATNDPASRETRFPPELRPPLEPRSFTREDEGTSWRFAVDDLDVSFSDRFRGEVTSNPSRTVGDFVVWTKDREPAYQLATVVDDHRMGVTDIVRGDDLLDSAARQLLLFRALRFAPEPRFWHLPLVVGPDGRRLAKRHGDTRLATYRDAGIAPERIIALLARWCGIDAGESLNASAFADALDLDRMDRSQTVFTEEDDQWLRSG